MQTANQAPTNLCTACPRTAAHALVLAEEERGDWKRERVRTQSGGGVVEDGGGLHDGGAHGGRAWVGAAVHLHLVDHRPGARARGHQSHQSGRRGLLLPLARGRRGSGGTSRAQGSTGSLCLVRVRGFSWIFGLARRGGGKTGTGRGTFYHDASRLFCFLQFLFSFWFALEILE